MLIIELNNKVFSVSASEGEQCHSRLYFVRSRAYPSPGQARTLGFVSSGLDLLADQLVSMA